MYMCNMLLLPAVWLHKSPVGCAKASNDVLLSTCAAPNGLYTSALRSLALHDDTAMATIAGCQASRSHDKNVHQASTVQLGKISAYHENSLVNTSV